MLSAQDTINWSKEDSVWLINVLEGTVDLKINEATKKAIENGTLVVPSWMKNKDNKLNNIEIMQDLSDAGVADSIRLHSIDPYSMPPAVFALYVLYIDRMDSIYESRVSMITPAERKQLENALPASARNMIYYSVSPGGAVVGGIGGMDFNHILSMVFSPSYRQKYYNRKYATAYKNYFDEGAIKPMQLTEAERRQLRQAVRQIKVSVTDQPGQKRHGIDN